MKIKYLYLPPVICAIVLTVSCRNQTKDDKDNAVASYSASDPATTEVIYLKTDHTNSQEEVYCNISTSTSATLPSAVPTGSTFSFKDGRRGIWRLLDKPGGSEVPLRLDKPLSPSAVVELKSALPFGRVWEDRIPNNTHTDRVIPVAAFQVLHHSQSGLGLSQQAHSKGE